MMPIENSSTFFVGMGTLALINGNLAQLKGRSGLLWFLGSLLVGPLATFFLLLVKPAPQGRPE